MQQKRALNGGKNHYIAFDPWNLALHSMSLWSLDKLLFTSCIFTSIFFTSISVSWAFEFNSLYSFWSKLHKNQHVKQTDANQMNVAGKLTSLHSKNSNWREHAHANNLMWCNIQANLKKLPSPLSLGNFFPQILVRREPTFKYPSNFILVFIHSVNYWERGISLTRGKKKGKHNWKVTAQSQVKSRLAFFCVSFCGFPTLPSWEKVQLCLGNQQEWSLFHG